MPATLIGRPGASCGRHPGSDGLLGPDRASDAAGHPPEPAAAAGGVRHCPVTYRPATLQADTVAVDTVPSATYDGGTGKGAWNTKGRQEP
jgi:hypothetical protein